MATVTVRFKLDGDDPDDRLGVSEETYEQVVDAAAQVGGYDVSIEKDED